MKHSLGLHKLRVQTVDKQLWTDALQKPDWYLYIADDFKKLEDFASKQDHQTKADIKDTVYRLVEEAYESGAMPLATSGENLDKERNPIDTVVIHHTSGKPGMSLNRLNAIQLLRIYGMYYADPADPKEKHFKGKPVWSNHFYKDRQVFWGYHWLIRNDGTAEQILEDCYLGWHAGNWEVNTRSVGICIDDDLSEKEPSEIVLHKVAKIIKENYPNIELFGHGEVRDTTCPGKLFKTTWKQKLNDLLITP